MTKTAKALLGVELRLSRCISPLARLHGSRKSNEYIRAVRKATPGECWSLKHRYLTVEDCTLDSLPPARQRRPGRQGRHQDREGSRPRHARQVATPATTVGDPDQQRPRSFGHPLHLISQPFALRAPPRLGGALFFTSGRQYLPSVLTPHLTDGYPPEETRQHHQSVPGLAFFAATGPLGTCCGECTFFGCGDRLKCLWLSDATSSSI